MSKHLVIRPLQPRDERALWQLAFRDGVSIPPGTSFIAEYGGIVVGTLSQQDGRAIVDPRHPIADVAASLRGTAAERTAEMRGWARIHDIPAPFRA